MAKQKIAFLFPGQGAQYVGMGKDFYEKFAIVRETLQEAEEILQKKLGQLIFQGSETELTETRNSQVAIFVISTAILRAVQQQLPQLSPAYCAGLSLGEYTALYASQRVDFATCLNLVNYRATYMNDACEKHRGTMAVVLGLDGKEVEQLVANARLPNDLWAANFNCPGQVVISGTEKGIEQGTALALAKGAKRVLPLQVHGAFHSGLMQEAEQRLSDHLLSLPIATSQIELVMNVVGNSVKEPLEIRQNLIKQVTHPVRWEQGVRYMIENETIQFYEFGCGKTLSGFNKRIDSSVPTISIDKVVDLEKELAR